MGTRFHTRLAKVERVLGRSPDKKLDEHMARVMALLSYTDQSLLPLERIAGATVSEQQRLAEQRYDAAMGSLMAELTDDELTAIIDRLSEQGFNEQVVEPKLGTAPRALEKRTSAELNLKRSLPA